MDDHAEPRWRIGQVSARTRLTTRTLRYYEELGLLNPSERLAGGHRVYASEDLRCLYRVSLLRQLGRPLSDIGRELDDSSRDLSDTIDRHIGQLDQRIAALGRHRERMITVRVPCRYISKCRTVTAWSRRPYGRCPPGLWTRIHQPRPVRHLPRPVRPSLDREFLTKTNSGRSFEGARS